MRTVKELIDMVDTWEDVMRLYKEGVITADEVILLTEIFHLR